MSAVQIQRLTIISVMLLMVVGAVPAGAELQNHGPDGEYFHDTVTGLYWFDPANFHEQARVTLDHLADYSTTWGWATQGEVEALLNQVAESGSDLETVMGPRKSTIANGGPRWLGYYFGSGDDGWIVESGNTPDFDQVTLTGSQAGAYHLGSGAWFVSAVDPATNTAVIENDGIYFHDQSTGLYWYDPAEFFSFTRSDVVGWLGMNTDWRWATQEEVFGLLGKTAVDGAAIETVLGERSMTIGSGAPRWVGFYNQDSLINGLLLQADIEPACTIISTASTQAGAQNFNAGAWLVSDVDPTPNADASWGDVKRSYR